MRIIGFNGPPGSGKDTLAEMVLEKMEYMQVTVPVKLESLSMPLRKIAYQMVDWRGELDGPDYARFKDTIFDQFGVSGRQLMIDVSEKFLKPVYGESVLARMLLERNAGFYGVLLVRDTGFKTELETLEFVLDPADVYVVQVHRPGHTFEGDSREWVAGSGAMSKVVNDGNFADLRSDAGRVYSRMVNQLGWKL